MDNNEAKTLIETFKAYRDLLNPIQANLNDFIETYDSMRDNIEKLNAAFGGDIKDKLDKIYRNLSGQADKAADLSSRIDQFTSITNKYTNEVTRLIALFGKVEERISAVSGLENQAEAQIGRLDAILSEKKQNYNIKELQRTLDGYNNNVQRVSEFINKDVADSLSQSQQKLEIMKSGIDGVVKKQRDGSADIEKLLTSYASANELLKKIAEKQDVNETYIFDIIDKWADERKVKTKK
jgi:DNA repair ATPase RecN